MIVDENNHCIKALEKECTLFKVPKKSDEMVYEGYNVWSFNPRNKKEPKRYYIGVKEKMLGRKATGTVILTTTRKLNTKQPKIFFNVTGEKPTKKLCFGINSGTEFKLPGTETYIYLTDFKKKKTKLSRKKKKTTLQIITLSSANSRAYFISMNKKIKIIGIDARLYGSHSRGIGRYTKEIVDRVLKMDNENRFIIFLSPEGLKDFSVEKENIKKVLVEARWYTLKEQIVMPYLIWREEVDLMHFPHFNVPYFCPSKFIVTIHDLILTKFPSIKATKLNKVFYILKNIGYRIIIKNALKKSEKIIAVSEFTKRDIVKQFGVSGDKIVVIYEGVANNLKKLSNNLKNDKKNDDKKNILRYNIHKPYFIYVGSAYPHKNLEILIKMMNREKFKEYNLVIVGRDDYFIKRLKAELENINNNIIFTGFVPDDELKSLLKNALCYIFPSFYEGFGLPPLEAMTQGCPVVSSDSSSLPEVLGDAVLYFNPHDLDELEKRVLSLIENEGVRRILIEKGYVQVEKYDWDYSAKETYKYY